MLRWIIRIGIVVGVGLVGVVVYLGFLITTYEQPAVDPAWAVAGSTNVPPGAVTVRWTGTATLVFSDGETTWMTDGWFSRPGPLELAFGEIEPDVAAIEKGLARNGVTRAAGVFPVHSHYDHAMDAPEVARRTGALLLGSESTAQIGRGWGLPENQIRVLANREPVRLGRFILTPIESNHFQFPDAMTRERALGDPDISEPLVPPVGAFDYKVGKAYVLHVAHPLGQWLIVGSAGFVHGALEGVEADVVFLGTGGLGSQTADYRESYWRETVDLTRPDRIVPIHWDSLTGPIEGPFTGPVRAATFLSAGSDEALAFLKQKEAANPRQKFMTLPRYDEVVLFAPGRPSAERAGAAQTGARRPASSPTGDTEAGSAGAPAADEPEQVRELNRNPRVTRRAWAPRFERDSELRELEVEAAEAALERGLISTAQMRAAADRVAGSFDGLPPDEQKKIWDDAAREAAADAAIADYLNQEQKTPKGMNPWPMLKNSVDAETYDRIFREMQAKQ